MPKGLYNEVLGHLPYTQPAAFPIVKGSPAVGYVESSLREFVDPTLGVCPRNNVINDIRH